MVWWDVYGECVNLKSILDRRFWILDWGGKDASDGAVASVPLGAKETCHSTKRTHFIFAYFSVYQFYLQELVSFADAFANGFVLEKRT